MPNHAALLRGINVGGHTATKGQLVAAFERAGLEDVATFRASGNVIFSAAGRPQAAPIERELERELGFAVPVFLRSGRRLARIASLAPFTSRQLAASKGKLQVAFLPKRPGKRATAEAMALVTDAEPVAIEGAELLWLPRGSMRESDLDLKALERAVGPWTMRTMGTVEQLAAKL